MSIDNGVIEHATQTIEAGSKSFATAARLFDETTRQSAVMLYAWCRHCDDVVDGQQLGHGQQQGDRSNAVASLAGLERSTQSACAGQLSGDPVFDGLAEVVRRHGIPVCYLLEHLAGFRMDVEDRHYISLDDTMAYCWRVAGVVGVMMAMVMGNRDPATLDRACDLGLAFQLANIARDIEEDARVGRCYLPRDWLSDVNVPADAVMAPRHRDALVMLARRLTDRAERHEASARIGTKALSWRSAWAVLAAAGIYGDIARAVARRGTRAWDRRVTTGKAAKLAWIARAAWQASRRAALPDLPRDPVLWTRWR